MGLDLVLVFNRFGDRCTNAFYATDRLEFIRDGRIFAQLSARAEAEGVDPVCEPRPMPKKWLFYWDDDHEPTRTDGYGDKLTYLTAGDFEAVEAPPKCHRWNEAVLNFAKSLPEETQIILYWA